MNDSSLNNVCAICLDSLDNADLQQYKLSCGHEYHTACIVNSLRKSNECPYCRDTAGNKKISILQQNNNAFMDFMNGGGEIFSDDGNTIDTNDYEDMKEMLEPYRKLLKGDIKTVNSQMRELSKKGAKFSKDWITLSKNKFKDMKKQFSENDEYKTYTDELKKWRNDRRKLKNKFVKVLKDNGLELDSDMDDTLEDYLDEFLAFENNWEVPNTYTDFIFGGRLSW